MRILPFTWRYYSFWKLLIGDLFVPPSLYRLGSMGIKSAHFAPRRKALWIPELTDSGEDRVIFTTAYQACI